MLLLEAQSIKVYPGKGHGAPDKYLGISVVGGEGHPDTVITSILSPCLGQSTKWMLSCFKAFYWQLQ